MAKQNITQKSNNRARQTPLKLGIK